MMGRRTLVAALGSAVTVSVAGCAASQEEFEFSASPGTFGESTVSEAGYEKQQTEEIVVERTVDAGGQERDVTVTNYASAYLRRVSVAGSERTLAGAAVFTTPSISFVGQEFNPIADQSNEELVERAADRVESELDGGEIREIERVEELTTTVLGTETTVGVFSAVTEVEGGEIELLIHVTRVKNDGDFVLVAGAYPRALESDERPRLESLFGDVTHPDGDAA